MTNRSTAGKGFARKRPNTFSRWMIGGALACLLAGFGTLAMAQVQRVFPHDTQRARITFTSPGVVAVDGQPERLGPGAHVRDQQGRVPLPGALQGQTVVANYLRDPTGAIFRIWILTPQEARHAGSVRPGLPMTEKNSSLYLN